MARFEWSVVDPTVIRFMVARHPRFAAEDLTELDRLSNAQLAENARRVCGARPPDGEVFRAFVQHGLLDLWLPLANDDTVQALAVSVRAGLEPELRKLPLRTRRSQIDFLRERNITANFSRTVRRHFLSAHKTRTQIAVRPAGEGVDATPVDLVGEAAKPLTPLYKHQTQALERLDWLANQKEPSGVVVLPTGAGKTAVAVEWLLRRLESEPTARVLWISHQQELLSQAVRTFGVRASYRGPGFSRRVREIHGAASSTTTLAEPELAIAAVTIQSLGPLNIKARRTRLKRFCDAPVYVVVDEAHHAGATVYTEVLDFIQATGNVRALIGLTATPWPTSAAGAASFKRRFRHRVIDVTAEELIAERILAAPRLHTVETHEPIILAAEEVRAAITSDLPPSALAKVDRHLRNELVIDTWSGQSARWGKTLVFAANIDHADTLTARFKKAGAEVRAVHSRSEADRTRALEWFRGHRGSPILVSVGMLTEGVDLPQARTAMLARPTTSRILLRQMVGRVLRGPAAGGSAEANIVYFRDEWEELPDVLEPAEVIDFPPAPPGKVPAEPRTIRLLDEQDQPIPGSVVAEIERAVGDARWRLGGLAAPEIHAARLGGYFDLPDRTIAVFDHQIDGFDQLTGRALRGSMQGTPFASFFEDDPPPYPTPRALADFVEYVQEEGSAPPFVPLHARLGPGIATDRIDAAGKVSVDERLAIVAEVFDDTASALPWPNLESFQAAVDAELRERRHRRFTPEAPVPRTTKKRLRPLPRQANRDLEVATDLALATARRVLPSRQARRLSDPPPVIWTNRVVTTTFGHWTLTLHGKNAGRQVIRINRLFATTKEAVPDDMLAYLVYHELLHHLLPNQGHDAEFRDLEAAWPGSVELDVAFDTLHEHWCLDPARYV